MVRFTKNQWQAFDRIRRKNKVSIEFLKYNLPNILKFIAYFAKRLHFVIKRFAVRNSRKQSVIIKYNYLSRSIYDEAQRRQIKQRKRNLKQWSNRMVSYLRRKYGVKRYTIIENIAASKRSKCELDEVGKQLKEQLELLKSGKRTAQLMDKAEYYNCDKNENVHNSSEELTNRTDDTLDVENGVKKILAENYGNKLILNEMTGLMEPEEVKDKDVEIANDKATESLIPMTVETKIKRNFLDHLMDKVCVAKKMDNVMQSSTNCIVGSSSDTEPIKSLEDASVVIPSEATSSDALCQSLPKVTGTPKKDTSIDYDEVTPDSGDEFLGFDEEKDCIPGMMLTPIVPKPSSTTKTKENVAFVSEKLEAYIRENSLAMITNNVKTELTTSNLPTIRKVRQASIDGLMTLGCAPPNLVMPAVPEALQKLRTVAERRFYLQRFSKNHKLAIINNEATIYRELQRKLRQPNARFSSQQAMQANSSQMPFTRHGWQAASFITTEVNKYFVQKILIDDFSKKPVILRGVRGNNSDQYKEKYVSKPKIVKNNGNVCFPDCIDLQITSRLRAIPTFPSKRKLFKKSLFTTIKPCPLSQKPFESLKDEDFQILLNGSGGGVAIVRMPTVQLEVYPVLGKSFNDVTKRYLEYIMPYQCITPEWAEFSVSTLQWPQSTIIESENFKENGTRTSFLFAIPYANDRNQIVVRRIVDRNEELDPYFRENVSQKSELSFRSNLNTTDEVLMDCADVLSNMIDTVAISCSENSFISEDPDIIDDKLRILSPTSLKKDLKTDLKLPQNKPATKCKKSRLISELKRLNATIIDANVELKKKDTKPCLNDFCALGCICSSLENCGSLQEHCGKVECMLKCTCQDTDINQILRMGDSNHRITSEDAYQMRRQATARLARMEKEFTSTVVVTDNETLLINETQCDKKRRCAKIPKRYEDFHDTDDGYARISPVKPSPLTNINSGSGVSGGVISGIEKFDTKNSSSSNLGSSSKASKLQSPVFVKDVILKQLKHCSVPLIPLMDIENMAVWCMVHQLYKCHCGGLATEGKPMVIEKEEVGKVNAEYNWTNETMPASKQRYTFEKQEEENGENKEEKYNAHDMKNVVEDDSSLKTSSISKNSLLKNPIKTPFPYGGGFKETFYNKVDRMGCSRFVPVPSYTWKCINRKRRENVCNHIQISETKETQLLLNEHIMRSVYFHKDKNLKENAEENSHFESKQQKKTNECEFKKEEPDSRSVSESSSISVSGIKRRISDSMPSCSTKKKLIEHSNGSPSLSIVRKNSPNAKTENEKIQLQLPKISACYSLNSLSKDAISKNFSCQQSIIDHLQEKPFSNDSCSSESTISYMDGVKENYNEVIKVLNGLVSRKMNDIDNALKRDSRIVPPPTEDILCVLQWKNFVGAFQDELLYIWEVKMKAWSFLAATIKNVIPMVLGALGVINIRAVPYGRLPLVGRMLMRNVSMDESLNLAVIMQGRSQYWFIKGFLQPNPKNACLRPTPDTHPELTKKINTLCTSLIKQKAKENERKNNVLSTKVGSQENEKLKMESSGNQDKVTGELQHQQLQQSQEIKAHLNKFESEMKQKPKINLNSEIMQPTSSLSIPQQDFSSSEPTDTINLQQSSSLRSTNIEIRKAKLSDIKDIQQPQTFSFDHRWLILNLHNDFSHIFVPEQKEIISLDRIQRLMHLSLQRSKVIQIQFLKKGCFDAFIVPCSKRKIYFGPFPTNCETPVLVLLQSVDGVMMTREAYQNAHKIPPKEDCTTAFWMFQINGMLRFDEDAEGKSTTVPTSITSAAISNQSLQNLKAIKNSGNMISKQSLPEVSSQSAQSSKEVHLNSLHRHQMPVLHLSPIQPLPAQLLPQNLSAPSLTPSSSTKSHTTFTIQATNGKSNIQVIRSTGVNELPKISAISASVLVKNNKKDEETKNSPKIIANSQEIKNSMKRSSIPSSESNSSTSVSASKWSTISSLKNINNIHQLHTKVSPNPKGNPQQAQSSQQLPKSQMVTASANLLGNININKLKRPLPNTADIESSIPTHTTTLPSATKLRKLDSTSSTSGLTVSKTSVNSVRFLRTQGTAVSGNAMKIGNVTISKEVSSSASSARSLTTTTTTQSVTSVPLRSTIKIVKTSTPPAIYPMKAITVNSKALAQASREQLRPTGTPIPSTTIQSRSQPIKIPSKLDLKGLVASTTSTTTKTQNYSKNSMELNSNATTTYTIANSNTKCCLVNQNARGSLSVSTPRLQTTTGGNINAQSSNQAAFSKPSSSNISTSANESPKQTSDNPNNAGNPSANVARSIFGYFCANIPDQPRFLTKRIFKTNEYLIKLPGLGIARASGEPQANMFINRHIGRIRKGATENALWTFVPHSNSTAVKIIKSKDQTQNVISINKNGEIVPMMNSRNITIRKLGRQSITQSTTSATITSPSTSTPSRFISSVPKREAFPYSHENLDLSSTTILIED